LKCTAANHSRQRIRILLHALNEFSRVILQQLAVFWGKFFAFVQLVEPMGFFFGFLKKLKKNRQIPDLIPT
jgi:hypothetical protein